MKEKKVYSNMRYVKKEDMENVKSKLRWVDDKIDILNINNKYIDVVLMG
jgi:hypothetical protein